MTAIVLPEGRQSFTDANGVPLVGGKVFTYDAGTSNPRQTWTDADQAQPNTNPIILDGRGEATVFWSGAYKVVLKDSLDNTIWTVDKVQDGLNALTQQALGAIMYPPTQEEIASGAVIVDQSIPSHDIIGTVVPDRYAINVNPGVTDMTAASIMAITVSLAANCAVEYLGGSYLITDTLSMPNKTQIMGQHYHQYVDGGTKIIFSPVTAKSLFVPSGAPAAFRFGYSLQNLYILGNSASAVGNSVYAIDAHGWNKCLVRNVAINQFRTGVRCYATINNRFEFVQIQNCYIQDILYDGGFSTTDVWEQPYFGNAPIGVQTNGINLGIRWVDIAIEGVTTWGFNICKESYGFMVEGGYSEDVPTANVATNALFRVGFDGAALSGAGVQLVVKGGLWAGRNAGAVGACLDVDFSDGVIFEPGGVLRWTNAIRTSANTQTNQVVSGPFVTVTVGTTVSDTTKVLGFYPLGSFNSGTRNAQNLSAWQIRFPNSPSTPLNDYREYTSANVACTGAITTVAQWKASKVGNTITLTLPPVTGVAAAQPFFEFGELLGAAFLPTAGLAFPCIIQNNGASSATPGMIIITAAGNIRVYRDGTAANYTAAANAGLGQGCGVALSWSI